MEKRKLSSPHLPVGLSWRMIDKTTDTLISLALDEDAVDRDVTTTSLFPHTPPRCNAFVKAKSDGVLCGGEIFLEVYRRVDPGLEVLPLKEDGAPFHRGEVLFTLSGSASSVLRGERTALNFLAHLSGVATATVRQAAQQMMKAIMHEVRIADIRPSTKLARVSPPVSADSSNAPTTPRVAASVGVASPP